MAEKRYEQNGVLKAEGGSSMLIGWLGEHVFVLGVEWEMGVERVEGEASRENCPHHPGRKWCVGLWEGSARPRCSQRARSQENFKKGDMVCPRPLRPRDKRPRAGASGEVWLPGDRGLPEAGSGVSLACFCWVFFFF